MVLESGFEMYLPKPVDPDELVAAVAESRAPREALTSSALEAGQITLSQGEQGEGVA